MIDTLILTGSCPRCGTGTLTGDEDMYGVRIVCVMCGHNKDLGKLPLKVTNIKDTKILEPILKDIKLEIIDLWKEQNLINLLMPLSIKIKFQHTKLKDLDKLRKTFSKISTIDSYVFKEFNINNSHYKIYYYRNPK